MIVPVRVGAVIVGDDVVAERRQVEVLLHEGVGGGVGQGVRAGRPGAGDVSIPCHVEHPVPRVGVPGNIAETGTDVDNVVVRRLTAEEVRGVVVVDVGNGVVEPPIEPVDEKLDPNARRILGSQSRQGVAGPLIDDVLGVGAAPRPAVVEAVPQDQPVRLVAVAEEVVIHGRRAVALVEADRDGVLLELRLAPDAAVHLEAHRHAAVSRARVVGIEILERPRHLQTVAGGVGVDALGAEQITVRADDRHRRQRGQGADDLLRRVAVGRIPGVIA